MERLIGKNLIHVTYGPGTIVSADEQTHHFDADFPSVGRKTFLYPGSFEKHLTFEDKEFQEEVDKAIEKLIEERKRKEEQAKTALSPSSRTKRSGSKKLSRVKPDEELTPEEIQKRKEEIERQLSNIDMSIPFDEKTRRIFLVYQGISFDDEYKGSYLWAPISDFHYHERMRQLNTGDIIINYSQNAVVAVSEVLCPTFHSPQPSALAGHGWGKLGYRCILRYNLLSNGVNLSPIRPNIIPLRFPKYSAFDKNGEACQGYLYELEYEIALLIKDEILKSPQSAPVTAVLNRI